MQGQMSQQGCGFPCLLCDRSNARLKIESPCPKAGACHLSLLWTARISGWLLEGERVKDGIFENRNVFGATDCGRLEIDLHLMSLPV